MPNCLAFAALDEPYQELTSHYSGRDCGTNMCPGAKTAQCSIHGETQWRLLFVVIFAETLVWVASGSVN